MKLFLKYADMKGKIRVFCRVRPLSDKELMDREKDVVRSLDEYTVEHLWKEGKFKQQLYDRVFDDTASQDEVFEDTKVRLPITLNCILIPHYYFLMFSLKNAVSCAIFN